MAKTPRQKVRDHWLQQLKTILKSNQYNTDTVTVERRERLGRDLNITDCPAIIISFGDDRPHHDETMGGNRANQHFREWDMDLLLVIADPGERETLEDVGELFLNDVMRCLIDNRYANNGKPSNVRFDVVSHEFERMENKTAQYNFKASVRYDFTRGDLL